MSEATSQSVSTLDTRRSPSAALPTKQRWWLKSLINTGLALGTGLLLIAAVGTAQRAGWIRSGPATGLHQEADNAKPTSSVSYVCPMMCTPTRTTQPSRCSVCGMELAPVEENAGSLDERAVHIDPAARRIVNIQTATAESITVQRSIRSVGAVAFDESRLATISAYTGGRIEKLFADHRGAVVAKGGPLVELYSPDLYAAQVEYLATRGAKDRNKSTTDGARSAESPLWSLGAGLSALHNSAREKLRELGMTGEQIVAMQQRGQAESRIKVCAPIGGTVINNPATEGQYVKTGDVICRIADLSVVWLMLKLFPDDVGDVRYGQRVEAEVQSAPGEVFTGRVAFIDPVVDEVTRTIAVRVEILNADGRLRPGDYASATIRVPLSGGSEEYDAELAGRWISPRHPQIVRSQPGTCPLCDVALVRTSEFGYLDEPIEQAAIVVPRDAVLMVGSNSVVYVETEPGRFELRSVTVGPRTTDNVVILSGIKSGEKVATSGNFLIDSQMQLSGKPSLIDPSRVNSTTTQIAIVPSKTETN